MKHSIFILIFLSIFSLSFSHAQTKDCSTDFWTITADGEIQQWSLSNSIITGGDTILTGGGLSLGYCGNSNAPTFYTDNWNQGEIGINYYESTLGWINIPTNAHVQDNGGHLDDQFYTVVGGVIQYVNYWDGSSLQVIDSLPGEFFAGVYDIGVDTLGHAWITTASTPGTSIDSLKVYDKNGQINSFSFEYNLAGYGSFFLNNILYLGTLNDSIFPVYINGNTAELGEGIYFPVHNFTDMASCQAPESTSSLKSEYSKTNIVVFPNPSNGLFTINLGKILHDVKISVTDLSGKTIQSKKYKDIQQLNLKIDESSGVYLLNIETGDGKEVIRLIKE
ncbi:T9SS type A sorting domain-containing protein [Brumimicrobium mesophilum]|uniref:T9SS type A sorting domain-containing protein n=1 Tax=Brumimicrobium mesophilum TaxID=392717 RepID=UPI000D13F796|nr:T9SS type A sorting domain-containing protein [Brumimicrobium mesophilum]